MQDHGGYGDYGSIEGFESEKFEKNTPRILFCFIWNDSFELWENRKHSF